MAATLIDPGKSYLTVAKLRYQSTRHSLEVLVDSEDAQMETLVIAIFVRALGVKNPTSTT